MRAAAERERPVPDSQVSGIGDRAVVDCHGAARRAADGRRHARRQVCAETRAAEVQRDRLRGVGAERELRPVERRAARHRERALGKRGLLGARGAERQRARTGLFERTNRGRGDRGGDICGNRDVRDGERRRAAHGRVLVEHECVRLGVFGERDRGVCGIEDGVVVVVPDRSGVIVKPRRIGRAPVRGGSAVPGEVLPRRRIEREGETLSRRVVRLHPREIIDGDCREFTREGRQIARAKVDLAEGRVDVRHNRGVRHSNREVDVVARLRRNAALPVLGSGHLVVGTKSRPLLARAVSSPSLGIKVAAVRSLGVERPRDRVIKTRDGISVAHGWHDVVRQVCRRVIYLEVIEVVRPPIRNAASWNCVGNYIINCATFAYLLVACKKHRVSGRRSKSPRNKTGRLLRAIDIKLKRVVIDFNGTLSCAWIGITGRIAGVALALDIACRIKVSTKFRI